MRTLEQELKECIDQVDKNTKKLLAAISGLVSTLDYYDRPDEETIKFKMDILSSLNTDLINNSKQIEIHTYILIDKICMTNPDAEEYYKIKFNKPPKSNPDPGEIQDH